MTAPALLTGRAAALVQALQLQPHPEGGWYREIFRSAASVRPDDKRPQRSALTSIDFLLPAGAFSAWHQVQSDEAWHLLEGGPLRLWLAPPGALQCQSFDLSQGTLPRHVVPAGWWQAAELLDGEYAWAGATVGPGFEFDDFTLGREDAAFAAALPEALRRLL